MAVDPFADELAPFLRDPLNDLLFGADRRLAALGFEPTGARVAPIAPPLSASVAAFSPASLGNSAFWFDPSNTATVTLNGSDVSQINDLSGNSRDASQGTAAAQPAYTTPGLNGLNTITYTAANNDALSMANALSMTQNIAGFCFWGVFKIASLAISNRILSIVGGTGAQRFFAQTQITTGKISITTRRLDADTSMTTTAASAAVVAGVPSFCLFQCDYSTGTATLQVDGVRETAAIVWAGGNGNTENTASSLAPVLGRSGAAVYGGDMDEDESFARTLTTAEMDQLRTYCTAKWGTA